MLNQDSDSLSQLVSGRSKGSIRAWPLTVRVLGVPRNFGVPSGQAWGNDHQVDGGLDVQLSHRFEYFDQVRLFVIAEIAIRSALHAGLLA